MAFLVFINELAAVPGNFPPADDSLKAAALLLRELADSLPLLKLLPGSLPLCSFMCVSLPCSLGLLPPADWADDDDILLLLELVLISCCLLLLLDSCLLLEPEEVSLDHLVDLKKIV